MTSGAAGTGPPPRVLPSDKDRNAETLAWLSDALDAVAGINRTLMDDGKMDRNPVEVFAAAKPALRRLANFRSLAFLSVDQDGLTFDLEDVDPDRAADLVRKELEYQVAEGTFAWSIYQNRPVVVPGAHLGPWIVLHPLATPTRVLGMFMGSLSADSAFLPDTCQKVLSILMLNCASEMESGVLYRELNRHNRNLEAIIEERTEELRRSEQAARSASRAKSEFLANMSHEIRTPINGIVGMNSLMLAGELGSQQREQAETIQRSADNLLTIINDILDFSKIEAGHLDLEELPYDLQIAAEDVSELLSARAHAKGIEVVTRFRPGTPRWILGDPGRTRQILTNLVGNAIKFTETGHVAIDIGWTPGDEGQGRMRMVVEDTGIGIEQGKLDRIFEKFTQADSSTTRVYGGTGLGLSISRQLARLMGGELHAESEVGVGSRFIVDIPVELAEDGVEAPEESLAGVTVAVLAPNTMVRSSIKETLDAMGARTIVAPDIEALESLAGSDRIDVRMAMVDFGSAPQHLRETADRLRALSSSDAVHLILLSTMANRGDALAHVGRGYDGVLLKPVRHRRLIGAVAPVAVVTEGEGDESRDMFAQQALDHGEEGEHDVQPGAKVLLVEDEPVNRLVASQMIQKLGHDVTVVFNGQEAVEMLEEHGSNAFDVVLMDCQTPVLDGFAATRQIRAREASGGPRATIVALTASALQGDRERCIDAGMDDYLSKPVRIGDVQKMLGRWLAKKETDAMSQDGNPAPDEKEVVEAESAPSMEVSYRTARVPTAVGAPQRGPNRPASGPASVSPNASAGAPMNASASARRNATTGASTSATANAHTRGPAAAPPRVPVRAPVRAGGGGSEAPAAMRVRAHVAASATPPTPAEQGPPARSEPESSGPPVLDLEGAMELLGGEWDLFWTIADLFRDGWPDVQARFESAFTSSDPEELRQVAHFLKGSAGNVGAARAHALSADLEQRAKRGEMDGSREQYEAIHAAVEGYLAELVELRKETG